MRSRCLLMVLLVILSMSCQREVRIENTSIVHSEIEAVSPYAVSVDEALNALTEFLNGVEDYATRSSERTVKKVTPIKAVEIAPQTRTADIEDVDNLLYVVEFEGGAGSAILGADKRVEPIYAVFDETVVSNDDFVRALDGTEFGDDIVAFNVNLIANAALDGLSSLTPAPNEDLKSDFYDNITETVVYSDVAPMIPTKWGQYEPYNNEFPMETDDQGEFKPVAGCVTIAIGQLLAYLQPSSTIRLSGRTHTYSDVAQFVHNNNITDDDLIEKLGEYIYDLAEEMNPDYERDGTGISMYQAAQMLRQAGFSNVMQKNLDDDLIYEMVEDGRPVVICAYEADGEGHAWLIDGRYLANVNVYKATYVNGIIVSKEFLWSHLDNFVHCNFGWYGLSDGYYNYNIYNTLLRKGYEPDYGDGSLVEEGSIYNQDFTIIKYSI